MAHNLQDGYSKLERILDRVADNPDKLEDDRSRFGRPPDVTPPLSGTTTASSVSITSKDKEKEVEFQHEMQWKSSLPGQFFQAQIEHETARFQQAMRTGCRPVPDHRDAWGLGIERVIKEWREQGIWAHKWDPVEKGIRPFPMGFWKHEDEKALGHSRNPNDDWDWDGLLENESSGENFNHAPGSQLLVAQVAQSASASRPETSPDPNLSRPIHQFMYQVNKEREWFKGCHDAKLGSIPSPSSADINTQAYNSVKKRWKRWGVWNSEWGVLPGMSWKHEEPLGEFLERQRQKNKDAAAANDTRGQEDQALSVYSSPVPSTSSSKSSASSDRNLDLHQFIIHGNNSLSSLPDDSNSQGVAYSPIIHPVSGQVPLGSPITGLNSSIHFDDAPQKVSPTSAEAVRERQPPTLDSSPQPSITKPTEKAALHGKWQSVFHRRRGKTPKDSPRQLRFLKYKIWLEHEDTGVNP